MNPFVATNIKAIPDQFNCFVCGDAMSCKLSLVKFPCKIERIKFLPVNHGSSQSYTWNWTGEAESNVRNYASSAASDSGILAVLAALFRQIKYAGMPVNTSRDPMPAVYGAR